MRKSLYYLMLLFGFTSIQCSKSTSEDPSPVSTLSLSVSTLSISGIASDTNFFNITSNTDWTVASAEAWLTVSSYSGKNDLKVNITADTNTTGAPRTCTLTISATGLDSQTILVTQDRVYFPIYSVSSPNGDFKGAIVKIDPNTGNVIQTLSIPTDPNYEDGLAFDGTQVYYINGRTDAVGLNKIISFNAALTLPTDTFDTVFPERMDALAINKKDLYVLDFLQKKIYVVNIDSKIIIDTIVPAFSEPAIGGMTFGGNRGTIFVSSFTFGVASTYKVYEINASTGVVINSFAVPVSPFGLAYSEASHVLYISTGEPYDPDKSIYIIDPDTGSVLKKFAGSSSGLAADESSL